MSVPVLVIHRATFYGRPSPDNLKLSLLALIIIILLYSLNNFPKLIAKNSLVIQIVQRHFAFSK